MLVIKYFIKKNEIAQKQFKWFYSSVEFVKFCPKLFGLVNFDSACSGATEWEQGGACECERERREGQGCMQTAMKIKA